MILSTHYYSNWVSQAQLILFFWGLTTNKPRVTLKTRDTLTWIYEMAGCTLQLYTEGLSNKITAYVDVLWPIGTLICGYRIYIQTIWTSIQMNLEPRACIGFFQKVHFWTFWECLVQIILSPFEFEKDLSKHFESENIWDLKSFGYKKVESKKFWVEKKFGSKKVLVHGPLFLFSLSIVPCPISLNPYPLFLPLGVKLCPEPFNKFSVVVVICLLLFKQWV